MSAQADYSDQIHALVNKITGLDIPRPTVEDGKLIFKEQFIDCSIGSESSDRMNSILLHRENPLCENKTNLDYRNISKTGNLFGDLNIDLAIENSAEAVQYLQQRLEHYIASKFVRDVKAAIYGLDTTQQTEIQDRILKQATAELGIKANPEIDRTSAVARLRRGDFGTPAL